MDRQSVWVPLRNWYIYWTNPSVEHEFLNGTRTDCLSTFWRKISCCYLRSNLAVVKSEISNAHRINVQMLAHRQTKCHREDPRRAFGSDEHYAFETLGLWKESARHKHTHLDQISVRCTLELIWRLKPVHALCFLYSQTRLSYTSNQIVKHTECTHARYGTPMTNPIGNWLDISNRDYRLNKSKGNNVSGAQSSKSPDEFEWNEISKTQRQNVQFYSNHNEQLTQCLNTVQPLFVPQEFVERINAKNDCTRHKRER